MHVLRFQMRPTEAESQGDGPHISILGSSPEVLLHYFVSRPLVSPQSLLTQFLLCLAATCSSLSFSHWGQVAMGLSQSWDVYLPLPGLVERRACSLLLANTLLEKLPVLLWKRVCSLMKERARSVKKQPFHYQHIPYALLSSQM